MAATAFTLTGEPTRGRISPWAALCTGSLALLFATVWFSVALTYVSLGLAWASAIGWWLTVGDRRIHVRRLVTGVLLPVGIFLVASLTATLVGVAPARGFSVLRTELLGLGALAAGAAVAREADARRVLGVLLAAAAVSGVFGVYQVLVVFGGQLDISHRAHGFWHPGAHVSYGNATAMVAALALGWWLDGTTRLRWYAVAFGAAAVAGLVLSYTRAGWVGLGLVGAGVAVLRRSIAILFLGVLLTTCIALTPMGRGVLLRAASAFNTEAEVNVDRVARYRVALAVLGDHPILGTGPGGLYVVYPRYAVPAASENSHLHNTYLQILVERGAVALIAWMVLFGFGAYRVFRPPAGSRTDARASALGIGLALLVFAILGLFNYVWEDWRVRSLAMALLGLSWSPALQAPTREMIGNRGDIV